MLIDTKTGVVKCDQKEMQNLLGTTGLLNGNGTAPSGIDPGTKKTKGKRTKGKKSKYPSAARMKHIATAHGISVAEVKKQIETGVRGPAGRLSRKAK